MNKLYMLGCAMIGIGATLAYHAGRQDREAEIKKAEAKKWADAIDNPDKLAPGPTCSDNERNANVHVPWEHPTNRE